jgi:O-antigen ligase
MVRWGMLLLSGIAIFLMLLIGGRASIAALCSILIFSIFFRQLNSSYKTKIKTLVFFILTLFLVLLIHDKITDFLRDTIAIKRFLTLLDDSDRSQRVFLFSKAIELFFLSAKNVFFGAGINAYSVFVQKYTPAIYPHNIILELLAEYGVIGMTLFFSPIFYILLLRNRELSTLYGNSYHEQTIFIIVGYFWIIHMFTGGLRTSWPLVFFTCLLIPSGTKNTAEYLGSIGRPEQHVPRDYGCPKTLIHRRTHFFAKW